MDDVFYTIERPARAEIKRKGSRFIAEALTATTVDEAMSHLAAVRKREHAATHHCYGYRVGRENEITFKYSDDGEPNGSAGRPIYDVLCGRELTDTLLVVTRYFGGIKLGTGGLVRAYGDAAAAATEQAGRKINYVTTRLRIVIAFGLYDSLMKVAHRHHAVQRHADFADRVTLELEVRSSAAELLTSEIVQLSSGKAVVEILG